MAREASIPLEIDDFDIISSRTPIIADLKPGGRFVAVDVDQAGGAMLIAQRLIEGGYIDPSQKTVTGRTLGEETKAVIETPAQEVIRPLSNPVKGTGGLVILHGNVAPEGCVAKVTGHERLYHQGPARVYDQEEMAMRGL